jgi:allantoinase
VHPDLKRMDTGDFAAAWGGIAGLQFSVLCGVDRGPRPGHPGLDRVLALDVRGPGAPRGPRQAARGHRAGADADLVAFDPDATFTVTAPITHHRNKVTPYLGARRAGVERARRRWVTHPGSR